MIGYLRGFFRNIKNGLLNRRIDPDSSSNDVIKRLDYIFNLIITIIIGLCYILIIDQDNYQDFVAALLQQGITNKLATIIVVISSIMLFISPIQLSKHLEKAEFSRIDRDSSFLNFQNELKSRIEELEKRIRKDYDDSFKFFQKLIKEYSKYIPDNEETGETTLDDIDITTDNFTTGYKAFIEDFKSYTSIEPVDLNVIHTGASSKEGFKYECVIAFDQYFDVDREEYFTNGEIRTDTEPFGMIRYFSNFKSAAKKNQISRIFTIPGFPENPQHLGRTRTFFRDDDSKFKNSILLKYLIVNKICSIKTYLLVYDNNNQEARNEIFRTVDYVIETGGIPNSNEVYFAFPKIENRDMTISTKDPFILALMQDDFRKRVKNVGNQDHVYNIEEIKRTNLNEIYKILNFDLDTEAGKKELKNVFDSLQKELIYLAENENINEFFTVKEIKDIIKGYKDII